MKIGVLINILFYWVMLPRMTYFAGAIVVALTPRAIAMALTLLLLLKMMITLRGGLVSVVVTPHVDASCVT